MPIRPAEPSDLAEICALIRELADYEELPDGPSTHPVASKNRSYMSPRTWM